MRTLIVLLIAGLTAVAIGKVIWSTAQGGRI